LKILFVVSRYPWPPFRGDQRRARQLLHWLAGEHEVTLLAPEPGEAVGGAPPPNLLCRLVHYRPDSRVAVPFRLVADLGRQPFQNALFGSRDLARRLPTLAAGADLVLLQLARLAPWADLVGETPLVVDFIDSLSLNMRGRARFDHLALRPLLHLEAGLLARAERRLLARSRRAFLVAGRDLAHLGGGLAPELAERLRVLPLAPEPREAEAPELPPAPPLLAFTGNLGYFPNRDAARWWLGRVWPEVRRRRPEARMLVAGHRPGRGLQRLAASAGAELVVSPQNLGAELARATVALAPMRCGSGQPLKILEAWQAGVPVLATPWAAAGTTARAGRDLAVAETPEEWVEATLALLADPARCQALARAGRERLRADYAPETLRERFLGELEAVVA